MSEDAKKLRAMLDQLHAQLESIQQVDPEVRVLLENAVADIHRVVGTGDAPVGMAEVPAESATDEERESIADRLTEAARHFEESHPTLSGAVGSIIDVLGRMGI